MKLRFKRQAQDKYTNELYEANKEYEFKLDRANEILATPFGALYVEVVEEAPKPKKPRKKTK